MTGELPSTTTENSIRSETSEDKAGALPAVYAKASPNAVARVHFPVDQVDPTHTGSLENRSVADEGCRAQ